MLDFKGGRSDYILDWYKPPSERETKHVKETPPKPLVQSTANMILLTWDSNADVGKQHAGEKLLQGDFFKYLSRLGLVDEVQLNEAKSIAKVVFSNPTDAELILSLKKIEIRGRQMTVRTLTPRIAKPFAEMKTKAPRVQGRAAFPEDCNLVVKNLCPSINSEKLNSLFSQFG